jgi:N-acetylglucosaminylphosphatidylinositol deacetylase
VGAPPRRTFFVNIFFARLARDRSAQSAPQSATRARQPCAAPRAGAMAALGAPLPPCGGALLVIAHPDDEAMFFLPALAALRAARAPTHVLCLSTGDAAGLGALRRRELLASCAALGVPPERVRQVDDPALPDGMRAEWDPEAVAGHVLDALREADPSTVLSFDARGVSGHANHAAAHAGVLAARRRAGAPARPRVWLMLESAPLWRKFLGPLAIILALLLLLLRRRPHETLCVGGGWAAAARAMRAHRSQLVWFRCLYICLSSYVHVNTLVPLA